jgi:hypothetical protein
VSNTAAAAAMRPRTTAVYTSGAPKANRHRGYTRAKAKARQAAIKPPKAASRENSRLYPARNRAAAPTLPFNDGA